MREHVFEGSRSTTGKGTGGLGKHDLVRNKSGKLVSKKLQKAGKKSPWIAACAAAKFILNIRGFAIIKKGSPLYIKAKEIHKKFKPEH